MHVTCVVLCNAERKNGADTRDPRVEGWLTVVREARSCSVGTSYTSFWDPAEPLENWRAWKRRESALSSGPIQNNEHCGVWVLTPSVLAQTKSRCYMKRLSAWLVGSGAEKTMGSPFEHGLLTKESLWMGYYIITLLLANKNKQTKAKTTERGRAGREREEEGEKGTQRERETSLFLCWWQEDGGGEEGMKGREWIFSERKALDKALGFLLSQIFNAFIASQCQTTRHIWNRVGHSVNSAIN